MQVDCDSSTILWLGQGTGCRGLHAPDSNICAASITPSQDALVEEEDLPDVAADEEENDGEQWVERIIELTRVTKVGSR
jgi:hypothetical protein